MDAVFSGNRFLHFIQQSIEEVTTLATSTGQEWLTVAQFAARYSGSARIICPHLLLKYPIPTPFLKRTLIDDTIATTSLTTYV